MNRCQDLTRNNLKVEIYPASLYMQMPMHGVLLKFLRTIFIASLITSKLRLQSFFYEKKSSAA